MQRAARRPTTSGISVLLVCVSFCLLWGHGGATTCLRFLESWDARQGGIRVKTEDELSMPAEKPGYASDIPAPQLVFSFFVIFRVIISYFIRCNSRGRHGWGALSKTVENGVGMTHLFCKHCAAASSKGVGWSSFTLHAASSFCRGLRFLGESSKEGTTTRFMVLFKAR